MPTLTNKPILITRTRHHASDPAPRHPPPGPHRPRRHRHHRRSLPQPPPPPLHPSPPAPLRNTGHLPRRHHLHQRLNSPKSHRLVRSRQPNTPLQHHARLHRPHHQRSPPRPGPRPHHRSPRTHHPRPHPIPPEPPLPTSLVPLPHLSSRNNAAYPSLLHPQNSQLEQQVKRMRDPSQSPRPGSPRLSFMIVIAILAMIVVP